jgi:hypothetical protein
MLLIVSLSNGLSRNPQPLSARRISIPQGSASTTIFMHKSGWSRQSVSEIFTMLIPTSFEHLSSQG